MMRGLLTACLLFVLSFPAAAKDAYIAIIIDDVGNNLARGERAVAIPGPLTYSILPFTRFSTSLANEAFAAGKEVMVHMPMASVSEVPIGPGGLSPRLTQSEFVHLLVAAVASVPHASGINNHMGSYLTQQSLEMSWLMDEVKQQKMFFVDSRTTPKTVAYSVARQRDVFSSSRDVFLDNALTFYEIDRSFRQLLYKARRHGTAIGIGHPHDQTLEYLEMALPHLEAQGIHLIPASNLIALQSMERQQLERLQLAAKSATLTPGSE